LFSILFKNNFFLLIILSSIWGSAFLGIKIAVDSISPISVVSFRLIIGAIILLIYFKIKGNYFNFNIKTYFYIFLCALFGNFIPFYLISWSELYIPSNLAGLLLSVAPIFAIVLSHIFTNDDKFNFLKLLGVIIGLIGAIFLIGYKDIFLVFSNDYKMVIPKIAVIIAALGYVISSIIAYNLKNINTVSITTITTIFAAIISIPFMLYYEINYFSVPTKNSIIAIIYLGIMPTAVAFLLRFYLINKAGPVFLSYVAYLIPIFSIFWGYLILKEIVLINQLIAIFFIFIGIYVGQKGSNVKRDL
tara:strand:- start:1165 stop:2073 length:909 start_codon:yes stop_codon:yes gene_type:complete